MKIGLIVIASNENLYLRDWVEYNKNIGFDNIILIDNSPENGDYPQFVIGDYISDGYVIYENKRHSIQNENLFQEKAYTEMFQKYHNNYDYLCFFDVDEFITFSEKSELTNIHDYCSLQYIQEAEQIKINWRVYGDNGLCHYDKRPVYERFVYPTEPVDVKDWCGNYSVNTSTKLIINCNKTKNADFVITQSPHIVVTDNWNHNLKCISGSGNDVLQNSGCAPIDYDVVYLRHYRTLTIEEFLYRRFTRGDNDARGVCQNKMDLIKMFASENKITLEKKNIIETFFKTSGRNYGKERN